MTLTTPLRTTSPSSIDGLVMLHDHGSTYADGAENHVLDIVRSVDDVSSTSDQLIYHATDWPTRYHLDPARANIVRALTLSPDARVLEIGAGCGAVTRYLAERVALVDALEPVPARAKTIVERTRELGNTQVFVGHIDDVPDKPAYDVAVVIGVLEYVASGADLEQPYIDFLSEIRSRLVPGGTLVLAIENKFGVKYLAGAPEDHSNRVADSMESYPYGSPARTFSRVELLDLMDKAGLTAEVRIALPDYKMTEAVIDPARVPTARQRLMTQVSAFPSPDWMPSVGRFADERMFWTSLVDAGLAAETGNSFLILATNGPGASPVWDGDLVGAYWPVGLKSELTHMTSLQSQGADIVLRAEVDKDGPTPDRPVVANHAQQFDLSTPNFVSRARELTSEEVNRLVSAWAEIITERQAGGGPVEWDLVPHRIVVADDWTVQPCRTEWLLSTNGGDWDTVRRRGVALLADRLARASRPDRWPDVTNVRGLANQLGVAAGLPVDDSWVDVFVGEEAELTSGMRQRTLAVDDEVRTQLLRDELRQMLDRPIGPEPLLGQRLVASQAELQTLREDLAATVTTVAQLRRENKRLRRSLTIAPPAPRSLRSYAPGWVKAVASPIRRTLRGARRG